jgi:hypothetical protein
MIASLNQSNTETHGQVAEMYEKQALAQSNGKKKKGGDADDGFW